MMTVPSNLIPTRVTQLPVAPVASADSTMMIVYQGRNYQIRVGDLLSVAGVPTTTQIIAGASLAGGGPLTGNVTLSVAPKAIGVGQLADSGVSSGTYGDATNIPVLSIDSTGRVTSASTIALSVSGFVPTARQVAANDGLVGGGGLGADIGLGVNYSGQTPLPGYQSGSAGTWVSLSRGDHRHPAVDLSADDQVDNILKLNNGGTGRSMVMNPGAIIWSGSEGLYVGPPGAAGQVLVSGGAGAPTWGSVLVSSDQPANVVYAGPEAGADAPALFRRLVNADIPSILTGKTISGSDNTLSNIGNAALTNSSITINGQAVSLGGSVTTSGSLSHPLTLGAGLTGGSFDGSAAVTATIDSTVVTLTGNQTLTGKTISGDDNTLRNIGNASLSAPFISINGFMCNFGEGVTILAANPQLLTFANGFTANGATGGNYDGSYEVALGLDTSVVTTVAGTQTLTGKTIRGSQNTLSDIGNASLTNSSITINGQTVSLGGSTTITTPASSTLTFGNGLTGGSFNGSAAVTTAIADTGVNAGSYNSSPASTIAITVNAQGQVTALASNSIAIDSSQITAGQVPVARGGTNLGSYANGDMLYASAATTLSALTLGPNGSMITSNGTRPVYVARSLLTVGKATNIDGGAAGGMPFQTGPGATTFLPLGSAGSVLIAGPLGPTWGNVGSGTF